MSGKNTMVNIPDRPKMMEHTPNSASSDGIPGRNYSNDGMPGRNPTQTMAPTAYLAPSVSRPPTLACHAPSAYSVPSERTPPATPTIAKGHTIPEAAAKPGAEI